jgi:hypothetical protein
MRSHFPTLFLALSLSATAQSLAPGYAAALRPLPPDAGQVLVLDEARVVYFTGTRLVLDDQRSTRDLLVFQSPVFGSFTVFAFHGFLLFGESSTDGLWLVPIEPTTRPRLLATLRLNYAATIWRGTHALVSAKTGGFSSPNNDIVAVDLVSGALDPIAEVPGASGPVVIDERGDLVYATASLQFPPPPGSTAVVRWSAAQVLSAFGPTKLLLGEATTVAPGLDSGSAIAFDADEDLFVVDWKNQRVLELSDVRSGRPRIETLLDHASAPVSAAGLQWLPSARSTAPFEPFQPPGSMLAVHETKFATTSQVRALRAARPTTVVPDRVPPGRFMITIQGAPADGQAVFLLGQARPQDESRHALPGFEQPLWLLPGLATPLATFLAPIDAQGNAILHLFHSGVVMPVPLAVQAGFAGRGLMVIGSSAPAHFTLL